MSGGAMAGGSTGIERARALLSRERRAELVAAWLDAYERDRLRLPGPVERAALGELIAPILDAFAEALAGADELPAPGSTALRELEKSIGFMGARLAAAGGAAFDLAALISALREALVGPRPPHELPALFDWLAALASDAFATARGDAERERHREQLERGTPVVLIGAELPAVFLVAAPDRALLDAVLARLLLLIIRVGARTVLLDAGGLVDPAAPEVLDSLRRFAGHRKLAGDVELVAVGLNDAEAQAWRGLGGATVHVVERFDDAVRYGLARAGVQVVRRPGT